jgi:hypothetical protein
MKKMSVCAVVILLAAAGAFAQSADLPTKEEAKALIENFYKCLANDDKAGALQYATESAVNYAYPIIQASSNKESLKNMVVEIDGIQRMGEYIYVGFLHNLPKTWAYDNQTGLWMVTKERGKFKLIY